MFLRRGRCFTCRMLVPVAGMFAGLWGLTASGTPVSEPQTVRALVVGINDYAELRDLSGAVNDARDVAKALAGAGVKDLVVLEDGAATRERIAAEWRTLMTRADSGDALVLTYAGHGGQEPARVPGTERDGLDEVLLLGGFRSTGPGTRERIIDDELNQWFVEAGARDLRVIFVADSCHSGTLTRSRDPRAPASAFRSSPYMIADDMLDLDIPEEAAAIEETDLDHVSFLAAGQEHEQVPEIVVPDDTGNPEPRGALSYVFARAVEGEADLDGNGVLRRDELWRFVRENVRMISEARQTPNLLPNTRGTEPVLRLALAPRPSLTAGVPTTGAGVSAERPRVIRLAIVNPDPGTVVAVRNTLAGVRVMSVKESPDLIWDAGIRQVVTGMGDMAAHDVDLTDLPAVIEKWQAVQVIRTLSARASLRLRVYPHDGRHRRGSVIEVEVKGLHQPHLTLLGLSGNGAVHYLYPLTSDPAEVMLDQPFRLALEVTPPFGADHIVAVSADRSLRKLNAELDRLNGRLAARRAAELLAGAAAQASGWWSGIQGLYTVP